MKVKTLIAVAAALSVLPGAFAQAQQNPSTADLLAEFRRVNDFDDQFEVAKKIAKAGNAAAVLKELEPWLLHEDRHLRGNAAFVFASLGDARGFDTICAILTDCSARAEGQDAEGFFMGFLDPSNPPSTWSLEEQIKADRYYAVHLLGELKSARAVDVLLPLLADRDVNHKVMWALGQIGDRRAIAPLIDALQDTDASVRVSAINALVALNATEAIPHLRRLLDDQAIPSTGQPRVPVAATAGWAIGKLQKEP